MCNYIGLGHSPKDKFGRVMRIPDALVLTYFEVYTDVSRSELENLAGEVEKDPMRCKLRLAEEIVKRYHGTAVATQEREAFVETFSKRRIPAEIPEITLAGGPQKAVDLLKTFFITFYGGTKSNRELERLFFQGAVSLNGQTLTRPGDVLTPADGDVWQVGKRAWFRVKLV
jgi:tyrosyl-tRNA synthetase